MDELWAAEDKIARYDETRVPDHYTEHDWVKTFIYVSISFHSWLDFSSKIKECNRRLR